MKLSNEHMNNPKLMEVAEALLAVAPTENFLSPPAQKYKGRFIPLSAQVSKSKLNKNAVSIHEKFVSFMVPDWSLEDHAKTGNFDVERNLTYGLRLHFNGLTPRQIHNNGDFFSNALSIAKKESERRQYAGR